jgi:membrane-anchored glycerophosphoryl diester phosphodiesterase (GDPDase)
VKTKGSGQAPSGAAFAAVLLIVLLASWWPANPRLCFHAPKVALSGLHSQRRLQRNLLQFSRRICSYLVVATRKICLVCRVLQSLAVSRVNATQVIG